MFEFMDHKLIVATVLLLFTYGILDFSKTDLKKNSKPKVKKRKSLRLIYIVIIAIPFVSSYLSMQDAKESISKFNHNSTFKCHIDEFDYIVSKDEKWSVRGHYFTKDSLLIRGDRCEKFKSLLPSF